jgi:hypothetical protein
MHDIIDAKSLAILHLNLRWQSDFASYAETLYVPLNVWRELDLFPLSLGPVSLFIQAFRWRYTRAGGSGGEFFVIMKDSLTHPDFPFRSEPDYLVTGHLTGL